MEALTAYLKDKTSLDSAKIECTGHLANNEWKNTCMVHIAIGSESKAFTLTDLSDSAVKTLNDQIQPLTKTLSATSERSMSKTTTVLGKEPPASIDFLPQNFPSYWSLPSEFSQSIKEEFRSLFNSILDGL